MSGAGAAIAALLANPRFIAALSIGMDVAVRNLLSRIAEMTDEELEAFIATKEQEVADHEQLLEDQIEAARSE